MKPGKKKSKKRKDERMERILEMIVRFTRLEFEVREDLSGKGDELDAIIAGLNTLGEELSVRFSKTRNYLNN